MDKESIQKIKEESHKDFSFDMNLNETGDYRDTWRIFRIMSEFVEGYQFLNQLKNEVTILGSARLKEDDPYYGIARELGSMLARSGYTVITGGGPGIMEAANRGAYEADGESVGLNIQLPFEQRVNPYVKKSAAFYYFFTRKVMLTSPAQAFVYFPGGYGTLDEFFEVVDHIELGQMCHLPIVLVGKKFWEPLIAFLEQRICGLETKHRDTIVEWHIVDTAEEAFRVIEDMESTTRTCPLSPLHFNGGSKGVDWKVFRIMAELVEGFDFLTGIVEGVTMLGTRSIPEESGYYDSAYTLSQRLVSNGYTIVTGGGVGISEAANKAAMEHGGESVGIAMKMGNSAPLNTYLTKSIVFQFPFTRKLIVTAPSKAFIFFPGGFGTLHHLFEVLTLVQTGKMHPVPIILFDSQFWKPLDTYIRSMLDTHMQTISSADVDLYRIIDDEEEIVQVINTFRKKDS